MNVLLKGYFDRNFGDDIMQRMLIKSIPECTFFVAGEKSIMTEHLNDLENVRYASDSDSYDACVYIVGSGFIYNGKRAVLEEILARLMDKNAKIKGKTAVVNCNFESFSGAISEYLSRSALNKYEFISCRDEETKRYIDAHLKKKTVQCRPDMLFSLPNDMLPKKSGGKCLGISVLSNPYQHNDYEYFKQLARAADLFIERYRERVLFFAFDAGIENDISAAYAVRDMVKHREMTEIIVHNSECTSVFEHYPECGRFISSRFHSAVLALKFGIPLFAVTSKEKLKRLSREFGFKCENRNGVFFDRAAAFLESEVHAAKIPDEYCRRAAEHISGLRKYLLE